MIDTIGYKIYSGVTWIHKDVFDLTTREQWPPGLRLESMDQIMAAPIDDQISEIHTPIINENILAILRARR